MKHLLKLYIIETYSLYLVSQFISGMSFENGIKTLLITGLYLTIVDTLGKPVINLLLLPLNLVTFGVFRWVSAAVALFVVTLLVTSFKIYYFHFQGFNNKWIDIPVIHLESIIAFVAFSFVLSILISILHWIFK